VGLPATFQPLLDSPRFQPRNRSHNGVDAQRFVPVAHCRRCGRGCCAMAVLMGPPPKVLRAVRSTTASPAMRSCKHQASGQPVHQGAVSGQREQRRSRGPPSRLPPTPRPRSAITSSLHFHRLPRAQPNGGESPLLRQSQGTLAFGGTSGAMTSTMVTVRLSLLKRQCKPQCRGARHIDSAPEWLPLWLRRPDRSGRMWARSTLPQPVGGEEGWRSPPRAPDHPQIRLRRFSPTPPPSWCCWTPLASTITHHFGPSRGQSARGAHR